MDEKLHLGYTLYLSCDGEKNVKGGYLKKMENGLCPSPLIGSEIALVSSFSNVLASLEEGNTLQIYCSGSGMTTAMLGCATFEGPYGESECLDQTILAYHSGSISTLMELDTILGNREKKSVEYKKAYRLYGSDKYLFYTKLFIKNLEG